MMKKLNTVTFDNVEIKGGFWKQKQDLIRNVTINSVYNRFVDTGRFEAFKFDWKDGMPNQPHIFWESDVAKWIESAAYLIEKKSEVHLEKIVDGVVDLIEKNQLDSGYFNIYFTVVEPLFKFTRRTEHELYCAGHLIEAAVAYYHATGKDKFLKLMCKYADYIEQVFIIEKSSAFSTPGHEEIELALVKLYHATNEKRYLNLSKFFIDMRGHSDKDFYSWANSKYAQDQSPVREQTTAEGHSVRAVYLYSGMADIAKEFDDELLFNACKTIFDNIINQRMYITGAIGSSSTGEAFTIDYDLPNIMAYAESCAGLGLALFAKRMQELSCDSIYADTIERIIYNGFMSSLSIDGQSFFYENPLEINPALIHRDTSANGGIHYPITQRLEVFGCSCCPPNITRFIASIGDFLYSTTDNTIMCHQYMTSNAKIELGNDIVGLEQITDYPNSGKIKLTYNGKKIKIGVRIPSWCNTYCIKLNDVDAEYEVCNGYAYINTSDGDIINLDFNMDIQFAEADLRVQENAGRYALMRGPIIYCMEAIDNGSYLRDVLIDENGPFTLSNDDTLGIKVINALAYRRDISKVKGLYTKKHDSLKSFTAKLIPYYAFANRGETEMLIWTQVK